MSLGPNSFGRHFIITSFGESHGPSMGVVIDGCPSQVPFNLSLLQYELERRRPGQHKGAENLQSPRHELDQPRILSGVFEGKTLGTPIAIIVDNKDSRSEDYSLIKVNPRRGHGDKVWKQKFGHVDYRGGGRGSGRETISRVMGGAVAQMLLDQLVPELKVLGFARTIGPHSLAPVEMEQLAGEWIKNASEFVKKQNSPYYPADSYPARFPSSGLSSLVTEMLLEAKKEGKSYGGVVELWVHGLPAGLGQPVFHKLKSDLCGAMMSIGATCWIEVGDGMDASTQEGSQLHSSSDPSAYGGLLGGMSTGEPLVLRIGFKPTSSVLSVAQKGRHDPCILPRAIPVIEAMARLSLVDHVLASRLDRLDLLNRIE